MICRQAMNLIDGYLDGKLDEGQAWLLESHISGCSGCREELQERRTLLYVLKSEPAVAAPPDFTSLVMKSIGDYAANRLSSLSDAVSNAYGVVFKRLGLSFVVAAAVVVSSMLIPRGHMDALGISVSSKAGIIFEKASVVTGTIETANYTVKKLFRSINNSIVKFKEV